MTNTARTIKEAGRNGGLWHGYIGDDYARSFDTAEHAVAWVNGADVIEGDTALERAADRLVQQNVHLCLSSMVAALADGWDRIQRNRIAEDDLATLADQAADLRSPVLDYEEAARQAGYDGSHGGEQEWCEASDIEPYEWEVFEHWAVSPWLAEKLAAEGERIDTDFAGLNVWGRTTTGQSISMDAVIRKIAADMLKAV